MTLCRNLDTSLREGRKIRKKKQKSEGGKLTCDKGQRRGYSFSISSISSGEDPFRTREEEGEGEEGEEEEEGEDEGEDEEEGKEDEEEEGWGGEKEEAF